jgi:hypothetical protein
MKNFLMMPLGRPYRAIFVLTSSTQGVALGYNMSPRWGFRKALQGRTTVAQGNALGKTHPNNNSPERAASNDATPAKK